MSDNAIDNNIKVSVVFPVHNDEEHIRCCLESITKQTLKDIEIIFVDDYSSDNSVGIIKEMMAKDSRISLIKNEKNLGTLMTRKRGVMEARGEYIITADSDDWFELNALEIAFNSIKKKDVEILLYGARAVVEAGKRDPIAEARRNEWLRAKPERIIRDKENHVVCSVNRMTHTWPRLVKAELYKKAYSVAKDCFMTHGEDTYICWILHYYGTSFDTIPDVLYNWRYGAGDSTLSQRSLEGFKKICESKRELNQALSEFIADKNEADLTESLIKLRKRSQISAFKMWSKSVSKEDSAVAFRSLSEAFGEDELLSTLHEAYGDLIKNNKNKQAKIIAMQEKNKALKSSASMKIGRIITAIPRKIMNR